jgi:flagellar motor switch/type III secretory pathway protein FliN
MSELRIRSEAIPEEVWPEPFSPLPARDPGWDDVADHDFGPFVLGVTRALTALFGVAVVATPGRPPRPERDEVVPRVSVALAAALATVQMGGDLNRPADAGSAERSRTSLAVARAARSIAQVVDGVAERLWPEGCPAPGFDLDVAVGVAGGHVQVPAPANAVVAPPVVVPSAALHARVMAMPMRVRVEVASGMVPVARLLPLTTGTVLPIDPMPEMPLIMGDHRIGAVTLTPMPDGRQQAMVVAMGVEALGGVI